MTDLIRAAMRPTTNHPNGVTTVHTSSGLLHLFVLFELGPNMPYLDPPLLFISTEVRRPRALPQKIPGRDDGRASRRPHGLMTSMTILAS